MVYKVIREKSLLALEMEVNDALKGGWRPQGGIFLQKLIDGGFWFMQAMKEGE